MHLLKIRIDTPSCNFFAGGLVPNLILQPFFETVETASKNAASKRGDIEAANKSISYALLGMSSWIGK